MENNFRFCCCQQLKVDGVHVAFAVQCPSAPSPMQTFNGQISLEKSSEMTSTPKEWVCNGSAKRSQSLRLCWERNTVAWTQLPSIYISGNVFGMYLWVARWWMNARWLEQRQRILYRRIVGVHPWILVRDHSSFSPSPSKGLPWTYEATLLTSCWLVESTANEE